MERMKNWLSHLRYHFNWQCTLGANFPKENDTWFFICKKLPFSLDSTSCCSIILFFSCKLSSPNVLFTNFSQFSLHQISGKWTCPYQNRYHSLAIHLWYCEIFNLWRIEWVFGTRYLEETICERRVGWWRRN